MAGLDDQARRDLAHQVNQAVLDAGAVGMPLGMWAGRGDYASLSQERRNQAGVRALGRLDTALANLTAVREKLAQACAPAATNDSEEE